VLIAPAQAHHREMVELCRQRAPISPTFTMSPNVCRNLEPL